MTDYEKAVMCGSIEKADWRWERDMPHHPMSLRLVEFLAQHDMVDYAAHFDWRIGGDGDNGETLAYQMDAFFEMMDATEAPPLANRKKSA